MTSHPASEPPGDSAGAALQPPQLVRIGSVSELVEQGRRTVTVMDRHHILALAMDGRIYAVSNGCTHVDGRLQLDNGILYPQSREIRCIWHGGRFDMDTGQPTFRPCVVPLMTYGVVIDGDDVFAQVPADPGPMPDPDEWDDD